MLHIANKMSALVALISFCFASYVCGEKHFIPAHGPLHDFYWLTNTHMERAAFPLSNSTKKVNGTNFFNYKLLAAFVFWVTVHRSVQCPRYISMPNFNEQALKECRCFTTDSLPRGSPGQYCSGFSVCGTRRWTQETVDLSWFGLDRWSSNSPTSSRR